MANSVYQFVENIVVEWDGFAGAGAFDVLDEIGPGRVSAADRAVTDSPHNLFKLLLLPGAVARFPETYQFPDEVVKAVDFGGSSTGDGLQGRNSLFYRQFLDAIFVVGFGIGLVPAVPRCLFIGSAHQRKMLAGRLLSLSRRSRATVVFHRITAGFGFFGPLMMIFFNIIIIIFIGGIRCHGG